MTTKGLSTYGTSPVLLRKPKNTIGFLASAGDWQFFRSRESHAWYDQQVWGGANAIQSQTLVDWNLTEEFKTLK